MERKRNPKEGEGKKARRGKQANATTQTMLIPTLFSFPHDSSK